jgi:hypothetical protein
MRVHHVVLWYSQSTAEQSDLFVLPVRGFWDRVAGGNRDLRWQGGGLRMWNWLTDEWGITGGWDYGVGHCRPAIVVWRGGVNCHRGNKTVAAAMEGLDTVLDPSAIANGLTHHHQPLRQDPRTDVALGPQVLEEFLLCDHPVAVLEEVDEQIQGLRLELAQGPGATQFVALEIKRIVPKGVDHPPAPPGHYHTEILEKIFRKS